MKNKVCTKCKKEKSISDFGKCEPRPDGYRYRCKDCRNKYEINLRNKNPNFRRKDIEGSRLYRELHRDEMNAYKKVWRKTEKGKSSHRESKTKRKRELGYNELFTNPFQIDCDVEWHHIDNDNVVALPKDLHRLYLNDDHRENTVYIVKQLYGEW